MRDLSAGDLELGRACPPTGGCWKKNCPKALKNAQNRIKKLSPRYLLTILDCSSCRGHARLNLEANPSLILSFDGVLQRFPGPTSGGEKAARGTRGKASFSYSRKCDREQPPCKKSGPACR
eukprot:3481512-Pyramimonas_sp.AAC.1